MTQRKEYTSFCVSIKRDEDLRSLRTEYHNVDPKKRRMAAEWEYGSSMASDLFNRTLAMSGADTLSSPAWPPGFLALAIDPLYAPALLTVGSLEYQYGYIKEAMELFLTLTDLPEDEEDLVEIIDKSGDFLLSREDYENALELYLSAERAYPAQPVYCSGSGYCYCKLGNLEAATRKHRRAVELDPDNYLVLNDLGYTLLEAGHLQEAESFLMRSVNLAPPDFEYARNNLELLNKRRKKS